MDEFLKQVNKQRNLNYRVWSLMYALGSIFSKTGAGGGGTGPRAIRSYCFIVFVLFFILFSIRFSVTTIIFFTLRISIGFFLFRITAFVRNVIFFLLYCSFLQDKSKNKNSEQFSQYIQFRASEANSTVNITELAQDQNFTIHNQSSH